MHCLPADVTGVSCARGEVSRAVFERARLDKMLANNEIKSLVIALGTNIGEMFNIADLRYDRVIIMTDADVDGAHIRTLLLTLFFRYMPEMIRDGRVYAAVPPLHRVIVMNPGSKPNVLLLENDIRNAYKEQGNRTMSELTRDWLAGK